MAWEPFLGPRLKIERADRHISDLDSVVTRFLARNPYSAMVEKKPDCPDQIILRARERLPNKLGTIVGDAVHNLRTALDYLAIDLVALNGGNRKDVYFPFCGSTTDLEQAIKDRHVDRAAPEVVDVIRSLKPYVGGNDALRAIHDLDISDKHKLMLPIGYIAGIPNLSYKTTDREANTTNLFFFGDGTFWRGALDDGAELVRLPSGHNLKIGQEFKPTVTIAFAQGQPFEGKPIIPTLKQFSELVNGIVATFERMCLGA